MANHKTQQPTIDDNKSAVSLLCVAAGFGMPASICRIRSSQMA
ncbi:hypothetical protein Goklo_004919, partial [Gossypium klotzschianum]|nr:hypothetical protein [Gossypium klotzschianum]